jgi:hypothetical protein
VYAGESWTASAQGSLMAFVTTPNTTAVPVEAFRLHGSGGISFGSATDPGSAGIGNFKGFTRVAADFSKTNDTALADITGLTATLAPGKTYKFKATLYITADNSGGVGGLKVAMGGTCTVTDLTVGLVPPSGSFAGNGATALGSTVIATTTQATRLLFIVEGTSTVNVGGTLTVKFAQNSSGGVASTVHRGSSLEVWNVT